MNSRSTCTGLMRRISFLSDFSLTDFVPYLVHPFPIMGRPSLLPLGYGALIPFVQFTQYMRYVVAWKPPHQEKPLPLQDIGNLEYMFVYRILVMSIQPVVCCIHSPFYGVVPIGVFSFGGGRNIPRHNLVPVMAEAETHESGRRRVLKFQHSTYGSGNHGGIPHMLRYRLLSGGGYYVPPMDMACP